MKPFDGPANVAKGGGGRRVVLALNCGSSSIKFAVFGSELKARLRGQVDAIGTGTRPLLTTTDAPQPRQLDAGLANHGAIIANLLETVLAPFASRLTAIGHRVVHGGERFDGPAVIDAGTRRAIAALTPLAPLHQPLNLAGIDAIAAFASLPQVACFDTAFHRSQPRHRTMMPLPRCYFDQGLKRYGFHGLSYDYIAGRLPALLGPRAGGRVVVCHLGNGCSLAALVGGRSVHTTMGFTPLDGLMMGRRPGRLDPGAVLWLVEALGGDGAAANRVLNHESGLLGVSGLSSDMRVLLAADDADSRLAVTMFVDRLSQEIAAAAAAAGGIDALIFTGGIGENAAPIRAAVLDGLSWLGFALDKTANTAHAATITTGAPGPSAHVVPTDEERVIAAATLALSSA